MPHARRRTSPASLMALALGLSFAACSPRGPGSLHGLRRAHMSYVGGTRVTEVHAAPGPDSAFVFRAPAGRLLYVFFGYAHCPDICPTTLSDLRRALHRLGPDSARVDVAFVTVDPVRDSAAVLVPFTASFVRGTHALRPSTQEELATAERAFGATSSVTRTSGGEVQVSHTGAAYVVDSSGHVLVEWDYGIRPGDMAADLALLLRLQVPPR